MRGSVVLVYVEEVADHSAALVDDLRFIKGSHWINSVRGIVLKVRLSAAPTNLTYAKI